MKSMALSDWVSSHTSQHRGGYRAARARFFSTRTPLNFFAALAFFAGFFTATNSPPFLLRLVHALAPPSGVFTCDRFFTAPLRALSPFGLLTAILMSPSPREKHAIGQKVPMEEGGLRTLQGCNPDRVATMLELMALATAAVSIPAIVVLGLFRLAELKRAEDLETPPHVDEWLASEELHSPN
ncbi:hypothetical protein JQ634_03725 [Bradyrhizobium sp. AUGA SZCCT0240]|uniref:hypothetical protein n=1 Tax=unclassified Bradyrhizobium TaxID=2631580 RepID=UPI001BA7F857|nr:MULTISPECIES: hypothetical protein [unclassified Bradyrhizobium]MBR1192043.1 hypothetical protein [Bradyrhizobium sp. AUGA SZCCT0160]MBR1245231.1 hypothetical protein [Bradyrhizobium sp. AUGA SZCCT0274]MBR1252807.1 hypothetical protein [Bradyrhizobium sp. AUGA SZCCT0240]